MLTIGRAIQAEFIRGADFFLWLIMVFYLLVILASIGLLKTPGVPLGVNKDILDLEDLEMNVQFSLDLSTLNIDCYKYI